MRRLSLPAHRLPVQVEQKRSILREVLRRVGKIEFDGEIEVVAGEPWEYRNRVQLHVDGGDIGYFEHGSHTLCADRSLPDRFARFERCYLETEAAGSANRHGGVVHQ